MYYPVEKRRYKRGGTIRSGGRKIKRVRKTGRKRERETNEYTHNDGTTRQAR